jgi:hypothetical protein
MLVYSYDMSLGLQYELMYPIMNICWLLLGKFFVMFRPVTVLDKNLLHLLSFSAFAIQFAFFSSLF